MPSASASYYQVRSGLSPPSYCPWRAYHKESRGAKPNVIQIRKTERELELKQVPVSFFVKKIAEKG